MNERREIRDGGLSPAATEALLRLMISGERQRVSSAMLDGRLVWIKRYDVEPVPLSQWLHQRCSFLLPDFLRASPPTDSAGAIVRETRKLAAFADAGFPVPEVMFSNNSVLVLADVAHIAQNDLKLLAEAGEDAAHDRLLIAAAKALRAAHGAGLCHGRPHPRDMFIASGERWGFLDFEEEPEASMPLSAAQARDLWLLFLQICGQARLADTPRKALDAYMASPPLGVPYALRRLMRFMRPVVPVLGLLEGRGLGSDGRRVLKANRFLSTSLGDSHHQKPGMRAKPEGALRDE